MSNRSFQRGDFREMGQLLKLASAGLERLANSNDLHAEYGHTRTELLLELFAQLGLCRHEPSELGALLAADPAARSRDPQPAKASTVTAGLFEPAVASGRLAARPGQSWRDRACGQWRGSWTISAEPSARMGGDLGPPHSTVARGFGCTREVA